MPTCPEAHKVFAVQVQQRLLGPDGLLVAINSSMNGTAKEIAMSMIAPILTLELMFVGVRLALKQTFVEQFANFTRAALIAYIVIVMQYPQKMILTYEEQVRAGAQDWGYAIASYSPDGVQGGPNPIVYWGSWLGHPREQDSKYNGDYILERIFRFTHTQDQKTEQSWSDRIIEWVKDIDITGLPKLEDVIGLLLAPLMIGALLAVTFAQLAGYMSPVVAQISVLVGALFLLRFYLAIGLIVQPLMFFKKHGDIWIRYLTFAIGIALIPSFYYIMSGVGYLFATSLFDAMFPTSGGTTMGMLIREMVEKGIEWNRNQFLGDFGSEGSGMALTAMTKIIELFMNVFKKLLFLTAATTLVSTTVGGGVAFTALAAGIATSWEQAFNNAEMLEKIRNIFDRMQGSLVSGISQGYTQLTSTITNAIVVVLAGFFSKLKPGG